MTMPHIQWANKNHSKLALYALSFDPDYLASRSKHWANIGDADVAGEYAMMSIRARGHWTMINGRWYRNGL